jgi:predicted kinase
MIKLIVLKGLPASGKSTYAKQLLAEKQGMYKRVNRDLLRDMLDDRKWSKNNEKGVVSAERALVGLFISNGFSVIVDDTNLSEKTSDMWDDIASELGVKFEVVDFTNVPIDECIKRDQKRANYVGEKVIRRMAREHLTKQKIEQDQNLPHAVIFDIDGTLAITDHRSPYDTKLCELDLINEPVRLVLRHFDVSGVSIILVSGRSDEFREHTQRWLVKYEIYPYELFMRKSGDTRRDNIIKEEIYTNHIKDKYYVDFVMDDRDRVVDVWRRLGLSCFQVNYGDF